MTFDVPTQVTFNLKANCPNHGRTDVGVPHHTVVTDEPTHRGGTDAGAAPLGTTLSSYLGCSNVILNMLAEEKSLHIDYLSMTLTPDMDTNGIGRPGPRGTAVPRDELDHKGGQRSPPLNRWPSRPRDSPPCAASLRPHRPSSVDRRSPEIGPQDNSDQGPQWELPFEKTVASKPKGLHLPA